jgi:hypothetical protein
MIEYVLNVSEALGSILSTTEKKREREREEREKESGTYNLSYLRG